MPAKKKRAAGKTTEKKGGSFLKKKKTWFLIAAGVLLLVGVIVGIVLLLGGSGTKPPLGGGRTDPSVNGFCEITNCDAVSTTGNFQYVMVNTAGVSAMQSVVDGLTDDDVQLFDVNAGPSFMSRNITVDQTNIFFVASGPVTAESFPSPDELRTISAAVGKPTAESVAVTVFPISGEATPPPELGVFEAGVLEAPTGTTGKVSVARLYANTSINKNIHVRRMYVPVQMIVDGEDCYDLVQACNALNA